MAELSPAGCKAFAALICSTGSSPTSRFRYACVARGLSFC